MKNRYLTLDAIRGVAAIAVFFHHANGISHPLSMPSGYRAVDLFFVLSGFVLAHAYGENLSARALRPRTFLAMRLLRLYPLYLLGAMLGIVGAIAAVLLGGGDLSGSTVVIASLSLLLLLPSPTWMQSPALMPLNVPAWSLFFELLANIAYALLAPLLDNRRLTFVVAVAAIALVFASIHVGNANLGADWKSIPGGLARVTFSFFAGILIYRLHRRASRPSSLAWLLVAAPIPLLFVWSEKLVADLACILVIFPLLIYGGARIEIGASRIAGILGDTSYGIYVVHVPLILFFYKLFSYMGSDANLYAPWLGLATILALVPAMLVTDMFYDRPARRLLAKVVGIGRRSNVEKRSLPTSQ